MNSEVKKQWVEALRSGKYSQGEGELETTHKDRESDFCCLGVLCHITNVQRRTLNGIVLYDGFSRTLTPHLRDQLGITASDHSKLTYMNDSEKKNFNEIADYIEKFVW